MSSKESTDDCHECCPRGRVQGGEAHTQDGVAEDIEEEAYESDSDNANLLNIGLDALDGELLSNIRGQPTTPNPSGNTKKFPSTSKITKGSARNSSSRVDSKRRKKGSIDATSSEPLEEKYSIKRSVEVIEEMVKVNLLEPDSLLWCFAVLEMLKEPCRHMFLIIPRNTGRLAWLKY